MTPIAILRDIQFIFDCYKHPAQSEYYVFIYDMNQPPPSRIGIQPDAEQALTLRIFRASENPTPDTLHQFCQRFLDDAPFRIAWIRRKQEELEKFKATQAALDN